MKKAPPDGYGRNEFWTIVKILAVVWMFLGIWALVVWAVAEAFS